MIYPNTTVIKMENGDVYGFGCNGSYDLGLGHANKVSQATLLPHSFKQYTATAYSRNWAVDYDGHVYFIGNNRGNEHGLDLPNVNSVKEYTMLPTVDNIDIAVAVGDFALLLSKDNKVYSFGGNGVGQCCEDFTKVDGVQFPKLLDLTDIVAIDTGSGTGYALNSKGELYRWGASTSVYEDIFITPQITQTDVKRIFAGNNGLFIIKNDNQLYYTGDYKYGVSGIPGVTTKVSILTKVDTIFDPSTIKYMEAGYSTSFALCNDGTLYACGRDNKCGYFGESTTQETIYETFRPIYTDVKEFHFASYALYLIKNDGKLYSVGYNLDGCLGIGNDDYTYKTKDLQLVKVINDMPDNPIKDGKFTSTFVNTTLEIPSKYVIEANNKFYTMDENLSLVEITEEITTDLIKAIGIDSNVLIDNISTLPDKFSVLCNTEFDIKIKGVKLNDYMIVDKEDLIIPSDLSNHNLELKYDATDGVNIKAIFSLDGGTSWNTILTNNIINIDVNIPDKAFSEMNDEEKSKWDEAKNVILNNGVNIMTLPNIDLRKINTGKIRFAYAISLSSAEDKFDISDISLKNEELYPYDMLSDNDYTLSMDIKSNKLTIKPKNNYKKLIINILK